MGVRRARGDEGRPRPLGLGVRAVSFMRRSRCRADLWRGSAGSV